MSAGPQGPGWWLASDGKWYPPHLHPTVAPPPPPPPPTAAAPGEPATGGFASPPAYQGQPGPGPPPSAPPAAWGAPTAWPPGAMPPAWPAVPGVEGVDPRLGLALAPWWKRLLAIIIDNIILGLGVFLVFLVIGIAVDASRNSNGTTSTSSTAHGASVVVAFVIVGAFASALLGLYFAFMNGSRRGQTVGKMALSIAVRDSRTGGRIGFWRAYGRILITIPFWLFFFIPYLLDSLSPLWDSRRQAWHDKVASTIVVDLKP